MSSVARQIYHVNVTLLEFRASLKGHGSSVGLFAAWTLSRCDEAVAVANRASDADRHVGVRMRELRIMLGYPFAQCANNQGIKRPNQPSHR